MIFAVVAGLLLLGGAVFSAVHGPLCRRPERMDRVTAVLVSASVIALAAALVVAFVVRY